MSEPSADPLTTAAAPPADGQPADGQRSPWKVVVLVAAALIAATTMAIGLGSGGLDGGRELDGQWIYCAGQGTPTVWLESGTGEPALFWEPVYLELAASRRVCTRDRPGLGRAAPRTAGTPTADVLAAELASLISQSGEVAPRVLVGHGAGALTLRHYTAALPRGPAALFEIAPPTALPFDEDRAHFLSELPPGIRREYEALPLSLAAAPPAVAGTITLDPAQSPTDLARRILAP